MFPVHLYHTIYLCICCVLVLLAINKAPLRDDGILAREYDNSGYVKACVIALFFLLFFGLRPTENDPMLYMADTGGYAAHYNSLKRHEINPFYWMYDHNGNLVLNGEFIFSWIRSEMASLGFSVHLWLLVVASIYIIPKIILIKKWFSGYSYLAVLFVITSFSFYSGGINGIRNADASSIFLLGMSYLITRGTNLRNVIIGIILCCSSYYFHHSVVILAIALVASLFLVRNTNIAIIIWLFSIFLSLVFGNALAFYGSSLFEDDRASDYLLAGQNSAVMGGFSHTGFRWDFLLFSAMPILLGWYVTVKRAIVDRTYQLMLNTYIIANAVWIVFIYAAFCNRFAALSWSMYSYVLLYPLVRYNLWGTRQSKYTCYILLGQLAFLFLF